MTTAAQALQAILNDMTMFSSIMHGDATEDVDLGDTVVPTLAKALSMVATGAKMYASIGAAQDDSGLTDGAYFSVKSTAAGGALDIYRKDNASSSTLITSTPGMDLIPKLLPTESGYVFALTDTVGRAIVTIDTNLIFYPRKLKIPQAATIDDDPASPITSRLLSVNLATLLSALFSSIPTETGYAKAEVDGSGRIATTIDLSGLFYPRKLKIPQAATIDDNPTASLVSRIFVAAVGNFFQTLAAETGYAFALVDQNGRMAFGIPVAGSPINIKATRSQYGDGGPVENAAFVVRPYIDGNGKTQLQSFRKSDGALINLTSTGNNIQPFLTDDNMVLFKTDTSGSFLDVYVPAAGGTINNLMGTTALAAWGNSLTQGAGSSGGGDYLTLVATALGKTKYNGGIGGQTSSQIVARQGGSPTLITVSGNQIPASGAVSVTAYSQDIFWVAGAHAAGSSTGTVAGIAGTLAGDISGNYTFTRAAAGTATACPAGTPFIPDAGVTHRADIQILEMGRNNFASGAQVQADIAAAVAYLSPYCKKYLVLSVLTGLSEISGSANYITIIALNAALASTYGGHFVDVTTPPTSAEMAAIGYTPTSQDNTDIANGVFPTGMRADSIHLTNNGYAIWALRIEAAINSKGW